MRHLPRINLPAPVLDALSAYQNRLEAAVDAERAKDAPKLAARIEAIWKARRSTNALRVVARALRAMASGLERCMYCEDSHGCDVEHGYPKVPHPERAFLWPNLLWVCAPCNRQKNDTFDEELLDPTREDPLDHLVLSPATGRYAARDGSRRGAATLCVLRRLKSDPTLARGRWNALGKLRTFLREYDTHEANGRAAEADTIRGVIVEEPFSAVFAAVLRACTEPGAAEVLGAELVGVVSRHPVMHHWLREAGDARVDAAKPEIADLARRVRVRRAR